MGRTSREVTSRVEVQNEGGLDWGSDRGVQRKGIVIPEIFRGGTYGLGGQLVVRREGLMKVSL